LRPQHKSGATRTFMIMFLHETLNRMQRLTGRDSEA